MTLRILPVGTHALLVELPGLAEVRALAAELRERPEPGQLDVLAAAGTVLVTADSPVAVRRLAARIRAADLSVPVPLPDAAVTLDVVYDGEDLAAAASLVSLSPEALIGFHSGQEWVADFAGFAPGFMYLSPRDTALTMPRRDSPRTRVPAGSLALGGPFSAVYPGVSPGGWQLIGRTAETLWDPSREHPALLAPGVRVRFRAVRELIAVQRPAPPAGGPVPESPALAAVAPAVPAQQLSGLRVLSAGPQTTIQDLGRPGHAHLGVTGSGALDRAALRRANRIAGNAGQAFPGAAGLEMALGPLRLLAVGSQVLAVSGMPVQLLVTEPDGASRTVPSDAPFVLGDGESLTVSGVPGQGFRAYVAVRGGLAVPAVLGSRATELLSGTGPAVLVPGAFLPVAPATSGVVGWPEVPPPVETGDVVLRYVPGPRDDWFVDPGALARQRWEVSAESNRVGLRFTGSPLQRLRVGELASEGMVAGALQVPPSGLPVLFLADHPVTGGYPVIGAVVPEDLDAAAQLAPGRGVRFVPVPAPALLRTATVRIPAAANKVPRVRKVV